ncbi:Flavin mononucleotide hydrolase 1 [Chlorella vulgaris]
MPMRSAPNDDGAQAAAGGPPILLLDVMDTIVYDPFFNDMPRFFDITFNELLAAKHPTAWLQFERAEISEEELFRMFFADGRPVDGAALKQHMAGCYRYLDGMEALLQRLQSSGADVHAFSNYPGLRKPSPESFAAVVSHLQLPPERLLFVDDRQVNVDGALSAGIPSVRFESAAQLEAELRQRGFQL